MKRMNRGFGVLLLAMAAASSHASFELMYLQDSLTGKITRWDPVNKVNLGSFGFPDGSFVFHTVTGGTGPSNRVYAVSGTVGTKTLDPNTGTLVGSTNAIGVVTRSAPSGAQLFAMAGSVVFRRDITSFTGPGLITGLTSNTAIAPISDNLIWSFGLDATGNFGATRLDFGSSTAGSFNSLVASSGVSSSTSAFGQSMYLTSPIGAARLATTVLSNTNQHRLIVAALNAPQTAVSGITTTALSGFSTTSALSMTAAHDGFWIVGDDATTLTTTRFMRFDSQNSLLANYTVASIDVPSSRFVAMNVLAPEPGTWCALALGAGWLGRRRKAKTP
jgi:hypothetical protein